MASATLEGDFPLNGTSCVLPEDAVLVSFCIGSLPSLRGKFVPFPTLADRFRAGRALLPEYPVGWDA